MDIEHPWRDREWLQAAIDRHGGYRPGVRGAAASGAVGALARELKCSQSTITLWVKKLDITPLPIPEVLPPLVPREDVFLELEGDALVLCDLHCPTVRIEVIASAIESARLLGITQCVVIGDLHSQDALASHDRKQESAGPLVEMAAGEVVMRMLLEAFESVIVTRGNHDRHAARALKLGENFDKALRMMLEGLPSSLTARMRVSNKDKAYLRTATGLWMLAHTYSYSRIAMSYPMKLAVRYNCHVVAAHRHHHGVCKSPNGKYAVEGGGAFDAPRMGYLHDWTNDLPEMANGYTLIVGGRPILPML